MSVENKIYYIKTNKLVSEICAYLSAYEGLSFSNLKCFLNLRRWKVVIYVGIQWRLNF